MPLSSATSVDNIQLPLPGDYVPYAPPRARVADLGATYALEAASKGRRIANFVLDQLFVGVIAFALVIGVALAGGKEWVEWLDRRPWGDIVSLLLTVGYYLILETWLGWTFAKLITRTRVVNPDGSRPGLRQIVIRSLVRLIPFEPLSFVGRSAEGWHDRWSDTRVMVVRNR